MLKIWKFAALDSAPLFLKPMLAALCLCDVCGMMFVGVSCASLTYFGDLLHCPHKRIVTITKVYIATNNIHVEIVRFRKNDRL